VSGNLPNVGNGDGVGYYFAEIVVPEPAGLQIVAFAGAALGLLIRRRAT